MAQTRSESAPNLDASRPTLLEVSPAEDSRGTLLFMPMGHRYSSKSVPGEVSGLPYACTDSVVGRIGMVVPGQIRTSSD